MRLAKVFSVAVFAIAACLAACAGNPQPGPVSENPKETPKETPADAVKAPDTSMLPADCKLADKVMVDGAVIYAIAAANAIEDTDYLTLDEAMAQKVATVKEVGADDAARNGREDVSGDVNKLLVCNDSDKPLFLMAGDLVLGGKQDRILAESVVVAPRTKNQPIPVFCVEHGRWQVQAKDSDRVTSGTFYNDSKTGQCDLAVKKAALESKEQGQVWRKVAENNKSLNVEGEAGSGTFRNTFDNKQMQEKIEANYAKAKLLAKSGIIGFAVFVDGKMVAMDVFDSSKLANKLSEKLLRSYIVTGISGGYTEAEIEKERAALRGDAGGDGQRRARNNDFTRTQELTDDPDDRRIRREPAEGVDSRPAPAPAERTENTKVNDRTENCREYKKDSLNYTCNDKTTGKPVQRSFMRR